MELFKFTHPTKTDFSRGEAINGYDSAMWVERYRRAGEFEIKAPLGSGLIDFLPTGTVISHTKTLEACVVENHEITEEKGEQSEVTITGRSFEAYLENRIVGANEAYANPNGPVGLYTQASAKSFLQAVDLINDHIQSANLDDNNDSLNDDILAFTSLTSGDAGTAEAREHKRGELYKTLITLLAVDDCGIRFIRKNPFGVTGGSSTVSRFYIHQGNDLSDSIIFSYQNGELESADYLWSIKGYKNVALVQGKWLCEFVYSGAVNYDRRVMVVNASDLDETYETAAAANAAKTAILAKMATRGREALDEQRQVAIANTDISKSTQYVYRQDYNIGDIVSLDGNYGVIEQRRVTEYVEIEDETGESGHPTLSALEV